LAGFPANGQAQ